MGPLLISCVVYALAYGVAETLRLRLPTPSLTRQVPATWLRGRRLTTRAVVWGLSLGSGLFTKTYYAGTWLIPVLIALSDDARRGAIVGAIVGLAHGTSRAVGIVRLMPRLDDWEQEGMILLARFRWKMIDGIVLLLVAGMLAPRLP